jgi:eukaryotic-like serine/threonine-protein kinase
VPITGAAVLGSVAPSAHGGPGLSRTPEHKQMSQPSETAANNSDRIRAGTALTGRYAVEEIIGYGGMSTVFRGRDTLLDRDIAIKVLNQQLGTNEADRAAFLKEARAAASLTHPGIVGTYDAGVFNGWPYIVMELVPGGSLKEMIDARAPLPAGDAVEIALSVADALEYGHQHGVVHCDVKPQNVLLDAGGRPKLVDFGISQSMAATAALTATISGTAGYVAPEQLEGRPLDGRADLYSLGTVLYQMLTRALPFEAPNLTALTTRRLVADPRPIRDANSAVPPPLAEIVMRCLARDRDQRFASAGKLAAALRSYQQGAYTPELVRKAVLSPVADATEVWDRPGRSAAGQVYVAERGHRVFWPLAVVLAALLGALLVVAVLVVNRNGGSPAAAPVPAVTNTRLDDAARQIESSGLKVAVDLVPSDQPVGTVLSQDPAPGTTQSTRDAVLLKVSRGPQP